MMSNLKCYLAALAMVALPLAAPSNARADLFDGYYDGGTSLYDSYGWDTNWDAGPYYTGAYGNNGYGNSSYTYEYDSDWFGTGGEWEIEDDDWWL